MYIFYPSRDILYKSVCTCLKKIHTWKGQQTTYSVHAPWSLHLMYLRDISKGIHIELLRATTNPLYDYNH